MKNTWPKVIILLSIFLMGGAHFVPVDYGMSPNPYLSEFWHELWMAFGGLVSGKKGELPFLVGSSFLIGWMLSGAFVLDMVCRSKGLLWSARIVGVLIGINFFAELLNNLSQAAVGWWLIAIAFFLHASAFFVADVIDQE
jgi:hypothetical protein